tara:strand:- start:68 stop:976 length:909 start_codon:yes stop_codon:yes gene_type:complete
VVFSLSGFAGNPLEPDSLKGWKSSAVSSLSFSQVSFNNWASGGKSSVSATGMFMYDLSFTDTLKLWENSFDIAFGIIREGDLESLAKSDDRIEFNTSYGWSAFKNWYYNFSFNFRSQSAKGYENRSDSNLISDFLAPAYSTISVGMSYRNTAQSLSLQVLPLSGKLTYVHNQDLANAGAFGLKGATYTQSGLLVTSAERLRSEFGGSLKIQYKSNLWENVKLDTQATLFSNYKGKLSRIDVDWQLVLLMKINKYLSANITTHLIYDDDIDLALDLNKDGVNESFGPRVQFKELFGLGLSYSF